MLFLARIFMYLLTAGVLYVMFAYSQEMPFAARIYPEIVSIIVGVLLIMEIVRAVPSKAGAQDHAIGADIEFSDDEKSEAGMRKAALVFASIFLLILGLYLFGFYATIPAFIFGYMVIEKEKPVWALVFAAVVGGINWYVFGELLSLPFPAGVLWE